MRPTRKTIRVVNSTGPWLCLLVVAAFIAYQSPGSQDRDWIESRNQAIANALNAVPWVLGEWISEDRPLPPSAVELLRPNASLSRFWRKIGSEDCLSMTLIHCSDTRDMGGHYPPVCYPAHGWSMEAAATETRLLQVGRSGERAFRLYRFSRFAKDSLEVKMTVVNAFMLPDGTWSEDLSSVRDVSSVRRLAQEGVAQIQLVFVGWPDAQAVASLAESFLGSIPEAVFQSLGRQSGGTESDHG